MSSNLPVGTELRWSTHALVRIQQRGIRPADVAAALMLGRGQWNHGDRAWTLSDRTLAGTALEHRAEELRSLEVIVTADGVIRTVKWNYRIAGRPGILRRRYLRERQA